MKIINKKQQQVLDNLIKLEEENIKKNQNGDTQCANFEICNDWSYIETLNLRNGLCFNCDGIFSDWENGKLIYLDNTECPICLEVKRCVKFLKCSHYVCINDFKRIFYGKKP